jgi:hypothetical protein
VAELGRGEAVRTRLLIGFGCPRSGTTFLRDVIGARGRRLREASPLHPIHSSDGLTSLLLAFQDVIFVRIVREPLEVAASLVALGRPELAEYDPVEEDIASMIEAERRNVDAQRAWLGDALFEVSYERLVDRRYRRRIAAALDVSLPVLDTFGSVPVRNGRLSAGLRHVDVLGERRAWWEKRLGGLR